MRREAERSDQLIPDAEADPGHEAGEAYIGFAIGDRSGYSEVSTSRNDRKWNRNYYLLRMLRIVYRLIR